MKVPHATMNNTLSTNEAQTTPIVAANRDVRLIQVQRSQCHFKVYVQGDNGGNWEGKTIFMTVHDVGSTPQSLIDFVNHPSMLNVKRHSVFVHVCVPGQDEGEPDLLGDFPSMDQLGEDLVHVLDALDIKYCIGLGEGAGADILCRFAMAWSKRCLGLVLIHCLGTPHGIIENFKEYLINLRLEDGKMNSADWDYLFAHKFGLNSKSVKDAFVEELSLTMNLHNLSRYLYAFSHRSDISGLIAEKMDNTQTLLVAGGRTPHLENVRHMHENLRRDRSTLLIVDDVMDVLAEAPTRLCRAFILFCKGLGELAGVQMPGVNRVISPSSSMEEADRPRFSPRNSISVGMGSSVEKQQQQQPQPSLIQPTVMLGSFEQQQMKAQQQVRGQ